MHSLQGNRTQLRPGFPIRTPSDQRFVDNSPRLNAVSHVLHRLSMPRHPPCALEQQTHTRITQHTNKTHTNKKQDARVHYTVLTHHTHQPPTNTQHVSKQKAGHKKEQPHPHHKQCRHHVSPQTPNSAPTIQLTFSQICETINHTHLAPNARVMHVHLVFQTKHVGSTTHGHSTNTPTTAGTK